MSVTQCSGHAAAEVNVRVLQTIDKQNVNLDGVIYKTNAFVVLFTLTVFNGRLQ